MTSCRRSDPSVFRIPTSRARFSLCAVLRFIKLIHANSNTKTPIVPNIQTYWIAPPTFTPFLNSEYKCQRLIGNRKTAGFFAARCALTCFSLESLITSDTRAKSVLSASSTYVETKLGLHGSSIVRSQVAPLKKKAHVAMNFNSAKLELLGKSSYTPAT